MPDTLSGRFIESCDCESLCPCWIDDDPDENHCTGLIAWQIEDGSIGGIDVARARVAAASTHNGRRAAPDGGRYSVLYVDATDTASPDEAAPVLQHAFTAPQGGVLADLAAVNGTVLDARPARIEIRGGAGGKAWCVRILVPGVGGDVRVVEAEGGVLAFDAQRAEVGPDGVAPLTLDHTALHRELAVVGGGVQALTASRFRVNLPSLPGGYVDRTRRSGMRGRFQY